MSAPAEEELGVRLRQAAAETLEQKHHSADGVCRSLKTHVFRRWTLAQPADAAGPSKHHARRWNRSWTELAQEIQVPGASMPKLRKLVHKKLKTLITVERLQAASAYCAQQFDPMSLADGHASWRAYVRQTAVVTDRAIYLAKLDILTSKNLAKAQQRAVDYLAIANRCLQIGESNGAICMNGALWNAAVARLHEYGRVPKGAAFQDLLSEVSLEDGYARLRNRLDMQMRQTEHPVIVPNIMAALDVDRTSNTTRMLTREERIASLLLVGQKHPIASAFLKQLYDDALNFGSPSPDSTERRQFVHDVEALLGRPIASGLRMRILKVDRFDRLHKKEEFQALLQELQRALIPYRKLGQTFHLEGDLLQDLTHQFGELSIDSFDETLSSSPEYPYLQQAAATERSMSTDSAESALIRDLKGTVFRQMIEQGMLVELPDGTREDIDDRFKQVLADLRQRVTDPALLPAFDVQARYLESERNQIQPYAQLAIQWREMQQSIAGSGIPSTRDPLEDASLILNPFVMQRLSGLQQDSEADAEGLIDDAMHELSLRLKPLNAHP